MTSTLPTSKQPVLKAIPPTPTHTPTPHTPTPEPTSETASPSRKWWMIGAMAGTIALLGCFPFPDGVSGDSEISPASGARQVITISSAGWVKPVVRVNEQVQAGQIVAWVKSEDVQQALNQATLQLSQAQSEVAIAQQQLNPLAAQVNEAETRAATNRQKTAFLQQQLQMLTQGTLAQVRALSSDQEGLKSQIAGLESQLLLVNVKIQRYQAAVKEGALPLDELVNQQSQKTQLTAQIAQLKHQIDSKESDKASIQQSLQQELLKQQAETEQANAALQSEIKKVAQGTANVATRQKLVEQHQIEQQRQQQRQQNDSDLRTTLTGTVVKANLDAHSQQYLPSGSTVLEVIDLNQLIATVQIRPEERSLIHNGDTAKICPKGTMFCYMGAVKEIEAIAKAADPKAPPTIAVKVQLTIQPGDPFPQSGQSADTRITTKPSSLYEKLQREFAKLIPFSKFF